MNTPTNIRDAAIHCEVRKIAYRQTKEGYAVTLLLHPQEVPPALATACLGARYMMALVELNDDETPKNSGAAAPEREGADSAPPTEAPSRSSLKSYAQEVGISCKDLRFRRFCEESLAGGEPAGRNWTEEMAAEMIRHFCGVISRTEIIEGTEAAKAWIKLRSQYEAWKRVPV